MFELFVVHVYPHPMQKAIFDMMSKIKSQWCRFWKGPLRIDLGGVFSWAAGHVHWCCPCLTQLCLWVSCDGLTPVELPKVQLAMAWGSTLAALVLPSQPTWRFGIVAGGPLYQQRRGHGTLTPASFDVLGIFHVMRMITYLRNF